MRDILGKKFWVALLIAAALIGSVVAVGAIEKNNVMTTEKEYSASADGGALYKQVYEKLCSRGHWLCDLMTYTDKVENVDTSSVERIFEQARDCGIIARFSEQDMDAPLDRRFVAQTTVRALGYKHRSVGYLADVASLDSDMDTMAYYSYFLPDINYMVYPDREIKAEEYSELLTQLSRYRMLRGKTILSFGDSIMFGSGNNGEGIADMIAEKYGMTAVDYSVPGASVGYRAGRGHIPDQPTLAFTDKIKPDIILLNGGTNDMNTVALGDMRNGFDMSKTSESDFTGGLEKAFWRIQQNWKDVPVVYIRVHNMDLGDDVNERRFGERALEVAAKWNAVSIDLYTDTDLNTELPDICNRYTCIRDDSNYLSDSIHPTALGYAKFYLPQISQAVADQFQCMTETVTATA